VSALLLLVVLAAVMSCGAASAQVSLGSTNAAQQNDARNLGNNLTRVNKVASEPLMPERRFPPPWSVMTRT
jgi:hypothetical protein